MAGLGDQGDILEAATSEAGIVETRLDGDNVARLEELMAGGREVGGFVDIEAEAMAETVEEAYVSTFAILGDEAAGLDEVGGGGVDAGTRDTSTESLEGGGVGILDGLDHAAALGRGLTFEVGACHVTIETGGNVARIDVHHDRLVGGNGAGAGGVAIDGLVARGDDQAVVVDATDGEDGLVGGGMEILGGEGATLPADPLTFDGGLTEDALNGSEGSGGAAIASGDAFLIGLTLEGALWKDLGRCTLVASFARKLELEAELAQALPEAGGEIMWDNEALDAVCLGGLQDNLSDASRRILEARGLDHLGEVEDDIKIGLGLGAAYFKQGKEPDFLARGRKAGKGSPALKRENQRMSALTVGAANKRTSGMGGGEEEETEGARETKETEESEEGEEGNQRGTKIGRWPGQFLGSQPFLDPVGFRGERGVVQNAGIVQW